MSTTTVIDQLIVKLGLDPKGFTEGEKKAAASTVNLEKQVDKSAKSMSSSMLGFIGKLSGIATAAIAIKKVVGYTSDLSTELRQLGLDSSNYNIAANALRNFGNIAEMNGGKASDATKTIGNLSKAVYDLAYNGSMSDSLVMLGRLGVQFQDTTGNMRDFKDIALDAQSAVQSSMKNGTSRANAYQELLQAGFDPGLANAMLDGTLKQQLTQQQARRQVSGSNLNAATTWEKSAANRDQAIAAAALGPFDAAAATGTALNNTAAGAADFVGGGGITKAVSAAGDAIVEGAKDFKEAASSFLHGIGDRVESDRRKNLPRGRAAYEADIQGAARKYGLNPETLAGLIQTESNFNPNAVSPTGRVGLAQLTPKYFPGAGNNPRADIYTAAQELARLKARHSDDDEQGAMIEALEDYNAGSRGADEMRSGKRPYTDETRDYPGKVLSYSSPSAGATITFENVNVTTTGTNGKAIANDFVDATRRKLQTGQADTGLR